MNRERSKETSHVTKKWVRTGAASVVVLSLLKSIDFNNCSCLIPALPLPSHALTHLLLPVYSLTSTILLSVIAHLLFIIGTYSEIYLYRKQSLDILEKKIFIIKTPFSIQQFLNFPFLSSLYIQVLSSVHFTLSKFHQIYQLFPYWQSFQTRDFLLWKSIPYSDRITRGVLIAILF